MFDVALSSHHSTSVSFNAVSGTLVKSCSESKIIKFHMGSKYANMFFDENNPHRGENYGDNRKEIIVLQVMLGGDGQLLVEYLDKKEEKGLGL